MHGAERGIETAVERAKQRLPDLLGELVAPGRALLALGDGLLAEDGLPALQGAHDDPLVEAGGGRDQHRVDLITLVHLVRVLQIRKYFL